MKGKSFVIIMSLSIFSVADNRTAFISQVNAYLIFPAGQKINFEHTELRRFFQDFISSLSEFAFGRVGCGINDEGFVLGKV